MVLVGLTYQSVIQTWNVGVVVLVEHWNEEGLSTFVAIPEGHLKKMLVNL